MCDPAGPGLRRFDDLEHHGGVRPLPQHFVRDHVVVKVGRDQETLCKKFGIITNVHLLPVKYCEMGIYNDD